MHLSDALMDLPENHSRNVLLMLFAQKKDQSNVKMVLVNNLTLNVISESNVILDKRDALMDLALFQVVVLLLLVLKKLLIIVMMELVEMTPEIALKYLNAQILHLFFVLMVVAHLEEYIVQDSLFVLFIFQLDALICNVIRMFLNVNHKKVVPPGKSSVKMDLVPHLLKTVLKSNVHHIFLSNVKMVSVYLIKNSVMMKPILVPITSLKNALTENVSMTYLLVKKLYVPMKTCHSFVLMDLAIPMNLNVPTNKDVLKILLSDVVPDNVLTLK